MPSKQAVRLNKMDYRPLEVLSKSTFVKLKILFLQPLLNWLSFECSSPEIYTLKRKDVIFGNEPKVMAQAVNTKNKKSQSVPLHPELTKELEQYFTENLALPHTKAFSGIWKDAGTDMLKQDLKLADIEYETEEGVADFHSLQHTFGTLLAQSGVLPQEAQKLMRHSDVNLTMNIYTHLQYDDKAKAINKLPNIKITKKKQLKTGTADVPEKLTGNLTGNPIKTQQNTAKYSKVEVCKNSNTKVETLVNKRVTKTRPAGLEPATYGLEIRCSVQLSYGRFNFKSLQYNNFLFVLSTLFNSKIPRAPKCAKKRTLTTPLFSCSG